MQNFLRSVQVHREQPFYNILQSRQTHGLSVVVIYNGQIEPLGSGAVNAEYHIFWGWGPAQDHIILVLKDPYFIPPSLIQDSDIQSPERVRTELSEGVPPCLYCPGCDFKSYCLS